MDNLHKSYKGRVVSKEKKVKPIKKSVLETFKRVGIDYEMLKTIGEQGVEWVAVNWLSREQIRTSPLIFACIGFVYETQLKYEKGDYSIPVADFDRIRYFICDYDIKAYMTCID